MHIRKHGTRQEPSKEETRDPDLEKHRTQSDPFDEGHQAMCVEAARYVRGGRRASRNEKSSRSIEGGIGGRTDQTLSKKDQRSVTTQFDRRTRAVEKRRKGKKALRRKPYLGASSSRKRRGIVEGGRKLAEGQDMAILRR